MSISVAVAGASGYAGGELLRILATHPEFDVRTVTAFSNAGQPLIAVQPHLRSLAHLELQPTEPDVLAGHDVVFLALPHGKSGEITEHLPAETLVVDCGADHRLTSESDWAAFYGGDYFGAWDYGMPELPLASGGHQRDVLVGSRRIAVPGCNVTAITLALAPGIRAGLIEPRDLVAVLAVGPSGAGRALRTGPARGRDARLRVGLRGRRPASPQPGDPPEPGRGGCGRGERVVHSRARADGTRHPRDVDGPAEAGRDGCAGHRGLGGRVRGRAVRARAAGRECSRASPTRSARTPRCSGSPSTRRPAGSW